MNTLDEIYTREALVIYESIYGNTRRIAEVIGAVLGEHYHVSVQQVADVAELPEAIDLLVVGAPTHRHGASQGIEEFLDRVPRDALLGVLAAAFDTRYEGASWLTGSAAGRIAHTLKNRGAHLVAAPKSFFIEKDVPSEHEKRRHEVELLEPGEVERAGEWARELLEAASRLETVALAIG